MALTLSNAHFQPQDSTGHFVYALRRDEYSMLYLTKVSTASTTESFEPFRLDGTQVEEFGDYEDYVDLSDILIVGTSFKVDHDVSKRVDQRSVEQLIKKIK